MATARFCAPRGQRLPPPKYSEPRGRTVCRFSNFFSEYLSVTKLYVGNLPFTVTEESVRALFSQHGTVEKVSLISDRDTGQPRGFGFVEMANADAARAMQAINGTELGGRALKVNEAQNRERSGGGAPRRY